MPEFLQTRRHAAQSRAGRAQPVRRHGHAAPARGAVRRLRGGADARTPARSRRGGDGGARAGRGRVLIAGIDEAGRGPLAGPVFAAAVILDPARRIRGLRDSKVLTARAARGARASRSARTRSRGRSPPPTSPRSTRSTSCRRRCSRCAAPSRRCRSCRSRRSSTATSARGSRARCYAIVKGDRDVASISAASILAKTARDALLIELDVLYPNYGFAQNKGYGTPEHLAALERHGPCAIHRQDVRAGGADQPAVLGSSAASAGRLRDPSVLTGARRPSGSLRPHRASAIRAMMVPVRCHGRGGSDGGGTGRRGIASSSRFHCRVGADVRPANRPPWHSGIHLAQTPSQGEVGSDSTFG